MAKKNRDATIRGGVTVKEAKAKKGTPDNPHRIPEYAEIEDLKNGCSEFFVIEKWTGEGWEFYSDGATQKKAEQICTRALHEAWQDLEERARWQHAREHGQDRRPQRFVIQFDSSITNQGVEDHIKKVREAAEEQKERNKGIPEFKFEPPKGKKAPAFRWQKFHIIKRPMDSGEVR